MNGTKDKLISVAEIVFGSVLYSLTVQLFLLPSGLLTGGATGLAIAAHGASGLPVSGVLFVLNLLFLLLGLIFLGKKFVATTLLSSLISPAALSVFERALAGRTLTDDLWLNAIFASLGIGVSVGIVLRAGASTGGSDIPPLIAKKYFNFPTSAGMWIMDTLILLAQGLVYDAERIMYGLVTVILVSLVIDKVMLIGSNRTELKVISRKTDEIRKAVIEDMDRGVTLLKAEAGYSEEPTDVLLTVISNRELPRFEKMVHGIDPEAFLIITRVSEVKGNGFSFRKPGEQYGRRKKA